LRFWAARPHGRGVGWGALYWHPARAPHPTCANPLTRPHANLSIPNPSPSGTRPGFLAPPCRYDNERGYSQRVVDLAAYMSKQDSAM
jgi:hypothetical protein